MVTLTTYNPQTMPILTFMMNLIIKIWLNIHVTVDFYGRRHLWDNEIKSFWVQGMIKVKGMNA